MGPAAAASAEALRAAQRKATDMGDDLLPAVCAYAVARIEPANKPARDEAITLLTAALQHTNPRVQSAALKGLLELDTPPEKIAPHLTSCVGECDPAVMHEVIDVLASAGEAATPALIAALKRPGIRGRAAILLGRLGPKASAAAPELVAAIADKDAEVRREVLYALGAIIADTGPVDPAIVAALDDSDMRVRATAAYALGRAGAVAQTAVPKLRQSLESDDALVRVVSAWALAHIAANDTQTAASAVPVLMQGLKGDNAMMRRGSADALGKLGKAARSAVPALQAAAKDPDQTVRAAALAALEKIGAITITPPSRPVPKRR
jgi:HEAT repeat protein